MRFWAAIAAMTIGFIALAIAFNVPAGVFLLIGAAGMLLEKPTRRLSERLEAFAERMRAEAKVEAERGR